MTDMNLVTAVLGLIGIGMVFTSLFYRKSDAPEIASLNPAKWVPVWKQQAHFRGPGYALMRWGFDLLGVAVLLQFILMGWNACGR
ncbi:MAG: hypothetical protein Kow0074_17670 [Candidatus Zixiibacteriota bacterium]